MVVHSWLSTLYITNHFNICCVCRNLMRMLCWLVQPRTWLQRSSAPVNSRRKSQMYVRPVMSLCCYVYSLCLCTHVDNTHVYIAAMDCVYSVYMVCSTVYTVLTTVDVHNIYCTIYSILYYIQNVYLLYAY